MFRYFFSPFLPPLPPPPPFLIPFSFFSCPSHLFLPPPLSLLSFLYFFQREYVAYPRKGKDVRQILSMAARYTEVEKKKRLKITQLGFVILSHSSLSSLIIFIKRKIQTNKQKTSTKNLFLPPLPHPLFLATNNLHTKVSGQKNMM